MSIGISDHIHRLLELSLDKELSTINPLNHFITFQSTLSRNVG